MGTNARVPEIVSKAVSEELRVIRARRPKETIRSLSDRCGVPYSTLHKTLAGDRMVDVEELHKIAVALGTTGADVMAAVEPRVAQEVARKLKVVTSTRKIPRGGTRSRSGDAPRS